jgi:hypothetical protein
MLMLMLKSRTLAVAMRLGPDLHTSCRPSFSIHDFFPTSVSEVHRMTGTTDSRNVVSIGNGLRTSWPKGIMLAIGFPSTEQWAVIMFLRFALTSTMCSLKSFLLGSRPFSLRVFAHSIPPLAAYFRSDTVSTATAFRTAANHHTRTTTARQPPTDLTQPTPYSVKCYKTIAGRCT